MNRRPSAFTLVEMLVGIAVSAILVVMMLSITSQVSSTVRTAGGKMDAFQSAQAGFDIMTQKLADATLNTYYDYSPNPTAPTTYARHSDLHFFIAQNASLTSWMSPASSTVTIPSGNSGQSVFFQAPEGYSNTNLGYTVGYSNTPGLLNACGYYVAFGPDSNYWPTLFAGGKVHYRYRLMQAIQSTDSNSIYSDPESTAAETTPPWIKPLQSLALPIAENIIALIIYNPSVDASNPPNLISANYQYNSRQGFPPNLVTALLGYQAEQMPPVLRVTMVAIDGPSAVRLDTGTGVAPTIIESALTGKFAAEANFATDMKALETSLIAAHIRYQILTASVTLRESKWSLGK